MLSKAEDKLERRRGLCHITDFKTFKAMLLQRSLLIYDIVDNVFFYLDSCGRSNLDR